MAEFTSNDFCFLSTFQTYSYNKSEISQQNLKLFFRYIKSKQCWGQTIKFIQQIEDSNLIALCFYVLNRKLKSDTYQLSQQEFGEINDFIRNYIKDEDKIEQKRVYQAISMCVILVLIHTYQNNQNLLEFISVWFSNNQRYCKYLILAQLEENINDKSVIITQDKRDQLNTYIDKQRKQVLQYLRNVGESQFKKLSKQQKIVLIDALEVWIKRYEPDDNTNLHSHPILLYCMDEFQCGGGLYSDKYQIFILQMCYLMKKTNKHVLLFESIFQYIPQILNEMDKESGQDDFNNQVIQILCYFAQNTAKYYLVSHNDKYHNLVILILSVISFKIFQTKKSITNFLKFCQKFLATLTNESYLWNQYIPQLQQMFRIFVSITQFTVQQCQQLNHKEVQQLSSENKKFKTKLHANSLCHQLISQICKIMSPMSFISFVKSQISSFVHASQQWPTLQSYLCMMQIHELVQLQEIQQNHEVIDQIVSSLLQINVPYKFHRVFHARIFEFLASAMKLYSESNPTISFKIVQFVATFINTNLGFWARKQIHYICDQNTKYVLDNISIFVEIYKNANQPSEIMKGLIKAMCKDFEKLNSHLPELFQTALNFLHQENQLTHKKQGVKVINHIFQTIVTQNTGGLEQLLSGYFYEFWKRMKSTVQNKCESEEQQSLLQLCVKTLKYGFRAIKSYAHPYVKQIYQVVLFSYSKYPNKSYIYLVEILITISSDLAESAQLLYQVFNKTIEISLNYLQSFEKQEEEVSEDLSQDFIGMIARTIEQMPLLFFDSCYFEQIIDLIINKMWKSELEFTIHFFMVCLYKQYWPVSLIQQSINSGENSSYKLPGHEDRSIQSRQRARPIILSISRKIIQKQVQSMKIEQRNFTAETSAQILIAQIKAFPLEMKLIWNYELQITQNSLLLPAEKSSFLFALQQNNYVSLQKLAILLLERCQYYSDMSL